MDALQLVETELSTTGISIGRHPMSFLREELNKRGIFLRRRRTKKRDIVTVAGAVIVRQWPSTAKDVVFITMETRQAFEFHRFARRFRKIPAGHHA